jgi:murein DD-endopeptidase MepM/ murein hydrolase activator NlpD
MGLDFQPPNDSPIYAIADGVVAISQDDSYGYGNHVYIDHGDLLGDGSNIQSLYAHMQHGSVPLVAGQQIHVGDFIGLVGRTGTATGIHLHFELLVDGVQVDPFQWLQMNAK